jgi:vancomycin resistance protein VanJ
LLSSVTTFGLYAYTLGMLLYLGLRFTVGDRFWLLAFLNAFAIYLFLPLLLTLPLAILMRLRVATIGNVLLLVVILIWIAPYFLPKPTNVAHTKPLKIVTFNMLGDNRNQREVEAWLRTTDADLVLVQETTWDIAHDQMPHILDMYPYQLIPNWQWSNFILSRKPFLSVDVFTPSVPDEFYGQRVTVDWQGQQIAIYNVHMPVPLDWANPRLKLPESTSFLFQIFVNYDETIRNGNIRALIKQLASEPLPYIVAGDFNTSDHSLIYNELAAQSSDTFREVGYGFGKSWPVASKWKLPTFFPALIRIDYIWHSQNFTPLNAEQGPALDSDHLPLWATFELNTAAASAELKVKQSVP